MARSGLTALGPVVTGSSFGCTLHPLNEHIHIRPNFCRTLGVSLVCARTKIFSPSRRRNRIRRLYDGTTPRRTCCDFISDAEHHICAESSSQYTLSIQTCSNLSQLQLPSPRLAILPRLIVMFDQATHQQDGACYQTTGHSFCCNHQT